MLAVVKARNPLETMSWLRMLHLPPRCSSEFIKAFGIPGRIGQTIFSGLFYQAPGPMPDRQPFKNSSSGTIAFKCMCQKNACAHQAHHRCNRLDHRTNPLRPRAIHRTTPALHSQKDSRSGIEIGRE